MIEIDAILKLTKVSKEAGGKTVLAETRYKEILAILEIKKAVTVAELVETLKLSLIHI